MDTRSRWVSGQQGDLVEAVMEPTDRFVDAAPRAGASLAVGASVAAVGAAYLYALSQSGLLRTATTWWTGQAAPQHGPEWALPAVAAGVAIGGISLGVVLLSWLARSVANHPYRWLGPVLVGFALLVLQGMQVALPWKTVPYPLFVALSGFALLAGGAVLQIQGLPAKASGTFVLLTPLAGLAAGFAIAPGGLPRALSGSGTPLLLLVLALTALGVGLAALAGRSESELGVLRLRRRYEQQRLELVDAIERGRWTEARLKAAEHRASLAEQGYYQAPAGGYALDHDAAAFAAAARPRALWPWLMLGMGIIGLGLAAGVYFGLYKPILRRAVAQQAMMSENVQSHASELDQLRARLEAKQRSLQAEVAAARNQVAASAPAAQRTTVEPVPAAAPPEAKAGAVADDDDDDDDDKVAAPLEAASVAKSKAAQKQRASAKAKRAARRAAKRQAAAKPVAAPPAEDPLDRKTRRALRENMDDDPIGGLE
jgi:hypothetical protein